MPTIALDYTPAYEQGAGIGRYVRELTAALAAQDHKTDYRLFVAGAVKQGLPIPIGYNFQWCPTVLTPRWLARLWHRLHLPLPIETFVGKVDLYHATDFVLPPTRPSTRTLLQVHDLSYVRVPEAAPPSLKTYLDRVVPASVRRADHVLADSQATKDDLVALYAVDADKVTVLYGGVDSRFQPASEVAQRRVRAKYQIGDGPYILTVGTVQPRKNYARLIEALAQLRTSTQDIDLVIAGGKGWLEDPIYATIQRLNMQERVHMIGFVDDADLPALYSAAHCFAFPSLYEGFGLPVLESMACDTPVVTSALSSLPEVAGDAALLVDPYDTAAIADALDQLVNDDALRARLIAAGRQQIGHFTWTKAATQLLAIYQQML